MEQLTALGLMPFACDRFFDTEVNTIEFFLSLRPEPDTEKAIASWQGMASEAKGFIHKASKSSRQPARALSSIKAPLRAISARFRSSSAGKS
ncbi:hypothetical protein [Paraburkholderia sp. RL17-337-BIB-A]|uniref:hypothetical protein n=1 Tax=Paraburkholderia sp. RL17-337-BIB-A TaxID=3031636 RepID=UPI0038B8B328